MKSLRYVALAASCAAVVFSQAALSQTFPDRPVRMVLPQIPGGTSDVLGRIVAEKLSAKWGRQVVLDYRPGAAGNIGTDHVAKSAPNGYTWLLQYVGAHAINPTMFKKLPFDPVNDLTAVGTVASGPFVMVTNMDLPVKNMGDFLAFAKASPGKLNYGAQVGAVNHLVGQMLNQAAGINTVWIPYRGAADSLTDTMSGQLQFNFGSAGAVAGHVRAGRVRAIATTGSKRAPAFKDVPTFAEVGLPQLTVDSWWGLFVPAGTPVEIVRKINSDLKEVLAMPDLVQRFVAVGTEPYVTTPEQFAKIARDDIARWGEAFRQAGVKQVD
jgi:tripartite-type tricarboxylate transporter receptor subunit TctC